MYNVMTYAAIALTIIGQIIVGGSYLCGLACWMVANVLFLIAAVGNHLGKAEIIRNVCMSAITAGLIIINL
jgi:hypothetical protein